MNTMGLAEVGYVPLVTSAEAFAIVHPGCDFRDDATATSRTFTLLAIQSRGAPLPVSKGGQPPMVHDILAVQPQGCVNFQSTESSTA